MKIAICDDNAADLSNVVSIINDYKSFQEDKRKIEYTTFHNAVDLISAMESGQHYELVLLDILMPSLTGMDAAKEIRQFNQDIKIIFLSSSPEFAVDSYSVGAYFYALKPILKDKLIILLDKVISEMESHSQISLLIKSKTGLIRAYINKLEFVEVIGRTLHYHLTDGTVIEAIGSMSELEKVLLTYPCFIKVHRSYIVNMEYINMLNQKEIKMRSLAIVRIARANYPTVKAAYIAYSFKELQKTENL